MALDYTKKTARRGIPVMEIIHAILGIGILGLFIFMAIDLDKNRRLAPFLMWAVAVFNAGDVIYKIKHLPRGRKNIGGVLLSLGLTLIFAMIGAYLWIVFYW